MKTSDWIISLLHDKMWNWPRGKHFFLTGASYPQQADSVQIRDFGRKVQRTSNWGEYFISSDGI